MAIPEEILMSRKAVITEDTDVDFINELKDYNVNMGNCSVKLKSMSRIKTLYALLNIVVFLSTLLKVMLIAEGFNVLVLLVLIYGAGLVVFGICSRRMLISAFLSGLLIPTGWIGIPITLVNIFVSLVYAKQLAEVEDQPDFPKFREILLVYGQRTKFRSTRAMEGEAQFEELCDSRDARVREEEEHTSGEGFTGMPEL